MFFISYIKITILHLKKSFYIEFRCRGVFIFIERNIINELNFYYFYEFRVNIFYKFLFLKFIYLDINRIIKIFLVVIVNNMFY